MLELNSKQKEHVASIIHEKRKELYDYPGGTRDIASKIGVPPQRISMWIKNKRVPSHKELLLLAELFEVDFDELCGLNMMTKSPASEPKETGYYPVTTSQINKSLLAVCNITGEIVKRQRQMLKGKRNSERHKKWLERVQHYVDTI